MLPRTDDLIRPIIASIKQDSYQKPARNRAKVARSDENATGLAKVPAPKQRSNLSSALASKPLSERVLRPISVNITTTPVILSPPTKTATRRFRSGSEGKIQSLQPVDDPSYPSQQTPSDSCKPCALERPSFVELPLSPAETSQLSLENLKTLSNLLKSEQPPHEELRTPEDGERDSLLKTSEEGISEKYFSLAPTLGSSERSTFSPNVGHTCSEDSPITKPTALLSTFFNPGVVLPAPPYDSGSTRTNSHLVKNSDAIASTPTRLAQMRLETMILKQRRVDFDTAEIEPHKQSSENDVPSPSGQDNLGPHSVNNQPQSQTLSTSSTSTIGKVRCALLESERLLGIKWIHNVDTTLTTNPHITPEVRYHASMLFSLYWGSRTPKAPKQDVVQTLQPKAGDLAAEREAKKKLKLIAATAMACLTLTIKWYFDFCKPLFTLQLTSFCKTTDFRTFRVTPDDLILWIDLRSGRRTSDTVFLSLAGGLWLDSPHAFLEELIRIIPSLRLLSSVPSYLLLPKDKKDVNKSNSSPSEPPIDQMPKTGVRWDWPKVVRQFERTLAKATMWQEVLAFEASVLCVVALYISLDGVKAGYHVKNSDSRIVPDSPPTSEPSARAGAGTGLSEPTSTTKGPESEIMPPTDNNDTGGQWIWRCMDINDTMDRVCRATQVSGDDVEICLDWFCQSGSF
ncbi:hypothetical protein KEM48_014134 [Puccinia striiformis f. sp. tritici PST-130]|nr:hypothetical protein KEM48_014134 [Puccinia striiformis f. sp. tritici PST-130]